MMKRRKLEPVSQQENRARYKREDRKLSSLIKEFNDSADWQTIQQTALPKEIVETRDTLERLAPALHELKRGAPVMKRKHEASQDYRAASEPYESRDDVAYIDPTQLENVNPSYTNQPLFGDGYALL